MMPLRGTAVRDIFASVPTGVVALAAETASGPALLVASSFSVGVSFDPPMCAVAVQATSRTWPGLRAASRIGVSVLGTSQAAVIDALASRDSTDRFRHVERHVTEEGAVLLAGAALWLECEIAASHDAGDHEIVLLRVHAAAETADVEPVVLHRRAYNRPQLLR
ncbi:flavin reductase family protein [Actinoplanes sp. NBRC 101535]|uniref:flavin reductase family protein n=1 Tax=Actinoplanes sp. NBRC 101535 TaxID=3032196 RepID=UPI0024A3C926|nr:flavin reductase family protein [Actinoplanes sp. NBRC 101535]GLY06633.1 putative oxidoreductase [Actinoplanes sp. NBRC 101535]